MNLSDTIYHKDQVEELIQHAIQSTIKERDYQWLRIIEKYLEVKDD